MWNIKMNKISLMECCLYFMKLIMFSIDWHHLDLLVLRLQLFTASYWLTMTLISYIFKALLLTFLQHTSAARSPSWPLLSQTSTSEEKKRKKEWDRLQLVFFLFLNNKKVNVKKRYCIKKRHNAVRILGVQRCAVGQFACWRQCKLTHSAATDSQKELKCQIIRSILLPTL